MHLKIKTDFRLTLAAVFVLAIIALLPASVSANTYTFTWVPTGQAPDVDPLVSATGSITIDGSLFDTSNANQGILFRTDPANFNISAFHFVLVSDVGGVNVTDTFDMANIAINSGATFNSTDNPPVWLDATGGDTPSTEGDGEVLHLSNNFQLDMLGPHNETSFGSFVVSSSVPEPSTWAATILGATTIVIGRMWARRKIARTL